MVFNYDELIGTNSKSSINFVFRCGILCSC